MRGWPTKIPLALIDEWRECEKDLAFMIGPLGPSGDMATLCAEDAMAEIFIKQGELVEQIHHIMNSSIKETAA